VKKRPRKWQINLAIFTSVRYKKKWLEFLWEHFANAERTSVRAGCPLPENRDPKRAVDLCHLIKEFQPHYTSLMRTTYMLRKSLFAVLAVLVVAASSQAVTVYSDSVLTIDATPTPTPNSTASPNIMSTHQTWDITVNSTIPVQGFDFFGDGGTSPGPNTFGFFGPMNQVQPAGPTVWQDSNAFMGFVGANERQDSQFKFLSSTLTVVPGSATESTSRLQAAAAAGAPLGAGGLVVPLAQLVIPIADTASVQFQGRIAFSSASGEASHLVSGIVGAVIPEPASLVLAGLAMVGVVGFARRRS
jgi:hypothetical protein